MATDATGTPTPLGIPTYNINVDAPSGNGNNAQMQAIDALLQARATLASPAFTGVPTAPTPSTADNSTKLATTAFVKAQGYLTSNAVSTVFGRSGAVVATAGDYDVSLVTGAAPLASPTFTGTPAAPTPATADNSTKLATTAFVKAQGYLSSAVTTFNSRSGAVSPTTGDYTAAQVTNAADKASASNQSFASSLVAPSVYTDVGSATGSLAFSLSPDYGSGNYWTATIAQGAGSITVTINNPTTPPSGSQSGLLFIEIRNGTTYSNSISWGNKYVGQNFVLPTSIATTVRNVLMFAWDPNDSLWRLVGIF